MVMLLSSFSLAIQNQAMKGLDNAIENADEEAKQVLEQVRDRIQEQAQERLQNMTNIRATEETECIGSNCRNVTVISGDKEEEFLGLFKAKRNVEYRVEDNGEITRRQKIFDFLWR